MAGHTKIVSQLTRIADALEIIAGKGKSTTISTPTNNESFTPVFRAASKRAESPVIKRALGFLLSFAKEHVSTLEDIREEFTRESFIQAYEDDEHTLRSHEADLDDGVIESAMDSLDEAGLWEEK